MPRESQNFQASEWAVYVCVNVEMVLESLPAHRLKKNSSVKLPQHTVYIQPHPPPPSIHPKNGIAQNAEVFLERVN